MKFHVILGHHPALVNPYLSKVYENIDALRYTDDVVDNQSAYKITGIVSTMEEKLELPEVRIMLSLFKLPYVEFM